MNQDVINNLDAATVSRDAYRVVNAIQDLSPERQVAAVAEVLQHMTHFSAIYAPDLLLQAARRSRAACATRVPQALALAEYVRCELYGHPVPSYVYQHLPNRSEL